jgi:hypothetical protein
MLADELDPGRCKRHFDGAAGLNSWPRQDAAPPDLASSHGHAELSPFCSCFDRGKDLD